MYIPKPYFENIPHIGDLELDYIFYDNGYPILFTCKKDNLLYLCLCRTVVDEQKWIISEIDVEILEKLMKDEISIYDAFKAKGGRACIAIWSKENPIEEYMVLQSSQLSDEDLPENDLFLDDEGESDEYLEMLKNRIQMSNNIRLDSYIDDKDSHGEMLLSGVKLTYTTISNTDFDNHVSSASLNREIVIRDKKSWENSINQDYDIRDAHDVCIENKFLMMAS